MRAWLASGLHDGSGRYLTVQQSQTATSPGGGNGVATNVFDLAFVQADRRTVDERVQADQLVKGDLGPAQAVVDLTALRGGVQRVEGEPTSGPVEKVLVSSSNQGQGIDTGNGPAAFQNPGPGQNFHYLGRTQGYLVDLPPGWRPGKAVPEVMVLHGYNGYNDEEYFLAPKLRAAIEKLGYIGVYPLGRGDVQYEHDGELDLLEVQRAVQHDYAVDHNRVHLVGISMGGFGATKAAVRHPDLFADASVFVGGEQGDANVVNDHLTNYPITRAADPRVVGNLQDTPLFLGASAADADAGGASASVVYAQLRQVGDEAHVKQYLAGTHEPAIIDLAVPQMVPQWQRSSRPAVPARINYALDTSWNFGALADSGSAWLQHLQPATGTQGAASAEAFTLPRTLTALSETTSSGGSATDRSAYLLRDSLRHPTGTRPISNTLAMSLTNLSSSSADLAPLNVDISRRYCVDLSSDVPTTVQLTGLNFAGLDVVGIPVTRTSHALFLHASAGTTHVVLSPRGIPGMAGTPCPAAPHGSMASPAAGAGSDPGTGPGAVGGTAPNGGTAPTGGTAPVGTGGTVPTGNTVPDRGLAARPVAASLAATGLDVLPPLTGLALLAAGELVSIARKRALRRPPLSNSAKSRPGGLKTG